MEVIVMLFNDVPEIFVIVLNTVQWTCLHKLYVTSWGFVVGEYVNVCVCVYGLRAHWYKLMAESYLSVALRGTLNKRKIIQNENKVQEQMMQWGALLWSLVEYLPELRKALGLDPRWGSKKWVGKGGK